VLNSEYCGPHSTAASAPLLSICAVCPFKFGQCMSCPDTNTMLVMQIRWETFCKQILSAIFKKGTPTWTVNLAIRTCVPDLAKLSFGSLAWAEKLHCTLSTIETAVVDAVDSRNVSALLNCAYTTLFDAENPQNLCRFSSLKEHLLRDLLPARLAEYQHLAFQHANKLFQEAAQYLRSSESPSTEAPVLQQLVSGIPGCMVSSAVQVFKSRPFDVSGLTLEEDQQVQTKRAKLNAQLAKLVAAQKSLDNISRTAAFIPANQFHLGTYKEEGSAELLDPSDVEKLLLKPKLNTAALPSPDASNAEAEYITPNSPHSDSSSSSSQAGDSAASIAASTAASSKTSTPLPVTVLADNSSDTSSSEPAAPALDLNEAVAESSSAGSAAEVEAHPESVSPTSSSTSDDFVEV